MRPHLPHRALLSAAARTSQQSFAQALAARGFVTVTISYRLSGEAKFPAVLHDAKAATRVAI